LHALYTLNSTCFFFICVIAKSVRRMACTVLYLLHPSVSKNQIPKIRNQNHYKTRSVPLASGYLSWRTGANGSNLAFRSTAILDTWEVDIKSAATIWGVGQANREDSIGAADLSLRVVEQHTAALVYVGSGPHWLWHPVATDLGFVVVEEVAATLVPISQQLWKPITTHLGLVVVHN